MACRIGVEVVPGAGARTACGRSPPFSSGAPITAARDGKSVVVSDGEATTIDIPLMPGSAQAPQPRTYFPPAGGFRFYFFTLGPGTAALPDDFDAAAAAGQVQRDIPGLLDEFEADNPGMHTSDLVVAVTGASRA